MEFALVDDPEALEVALALVDECVELQVDGQLTNIGDNALSMMPSASISTSPDSQGDEEKKHKVRNYNPNRAREEQRRELLYLREKVLEMESKLLALKKAKRAKDGREYSSAVQESMSNACKLWEMTARHRFEQRLQSERENCHLKAMLKAQIEIAKGLEELLRRSAAKGSNGTPRFWNGSSDAEVFRELLYGLEKSYNEVGEVFGATGLEGMNMSSKMCRGEDGKLYMEIFASKVLQFDVREAGNAVWQYFSRSMEDIPSRLMYQKDSKRLECMNDVIVQSFGLELHANGTKADFRVKQMQRRYVEEEREVIVWRSFIDPVEFSGKQISDAAFLEKGYIVVKPSVKDVGMTLLQTCFIVTPDLPIRSLDECANTAAFIDFVLRGTTATIATSHHIIESRLYN